MDSAMTPYCAPERLPASVIRGVLVRHDPLVRRGEPVPPMPAPRAPLELWLIRRYGTSGHVRREYATGRTVPRTLCGQPIRPDARRAPGGFRQCRVCMRIVVGSWGVAR